MKNWQWILGQFLMYTVSELNNLSVYKTSATELSIKFLSPPDFIDLDRPQAEKKVPEFLREKILFLCLKL